MATYTELVDNTQAGKKLGNDVIAKTVRVDFTALNNGAGAGSADVVQVMKVPQGAHVYHVSVEVLTVEGGVATIDVGDGGSASRYHNDLDINAAAVTNYNGGYTYAAADTIDILANTASTGAAIMDVHVIYSINTEQD